MQLSKPWRVSYVGERPKPAVFANAAPDPARTLARRIDALTHALMYPVPYIRRMARVVRRDTCFIT